MKTNTFPFPSFFHCLNKRLDLKTLSYHDAIYKALRADSVFCADFIMGKHA